MRHLITFILALAVIIACASCGDDNYTKSRHGYPEEIILFSNRFQSVNDSIAIEYATQQVYRKAKAQNGRFRYYLID